MKIAVYGVSRSGKDFFINDLINIFGDKEDINIDLHHINGSEVLKNISLQKYNRKFNNLSELEKSFVRKAFVEYINEQEKQYEDIIVDGHYAFYNDDMTFNKVFTEYDLNAYDYFFYLDTNPKDIVSRMRLSDGEKKNDVLTEEDIVEWKNYEIDNMTNDLLSVDKELHVIKYESDLAIHYVLGVLDGLYDSKAKANRMLKDVDIDEFSSVILLDCDKTVTYEDTTSIVLNDKNIDSSILKTIYKYDRYTNYQALEAKTFYESNKVFDEINTKSIIGKLHFNMPLIEDLRTKKNSKIIAVTAGNTDIWKSIFENLKLDVIVLESNLIMSKYVKYYIMKNLQSKGKYVVSIGDSMLDSLMLRFSNKSYIVSNKCKRENIQKLLLKNPQIHQLAYSDVLYDGVVKDNAIDSIRCLEKITDEIKKNIDICKSDSGIQGLKLRKAHYSLGIEVAKLIKHDYPNDRFVVVVMMRSGLCFAQGIADYFDCTELFYDECYAEKFSKEFYGNQTYSNKKIILVDGVINSGKSMKEIVARMVGYNTIIATNVISSKFNVDYIHPIYATRISGRSFVGAKQQTISDGKGPDTSDRLFRNL